MSLGEAEWAGLPEDDLKSICLIKDRRRRPGSGSYAHAHGCGSGAPPLQQHQRSLRLHPLHAR